ncbi:MAG: hypothetical protein HHAS10_08650 [Candidatus Altimarinota bacterium]
MTKEGRFEEKILYRAHQHWIVLAMNLLRYILYFSFPTGIIAYLILGSGIGGGIVFIIVSLVVIIYDHYLWHHSWLLIGNQKITLTVRNGLFSQYAMNIRYRNIRDSAVSKNNLLGYIFKYGTIFVRSSANEGDFQAHYVPKVGKVYAIINALSRYSDDERATIHTIEELYAHHQKSEFSQGSSQSMDINRAISTLQTIEGITEVIELSDEARKYIRNHEEIRNTGVLETISRDHVVVFLHNSHFRNPVEPIVTKNNSEEIYFPGIPFPEIQGKRVVSSSPGKKVHEYLLNFFPYHQTDDATVLVGWDV